MFLTSCLQIKTDEHFLLFNDPKKYRWGKFQRNGQINEFLFRQYLYQGIYELKNSVNYSQIY